MNLRTYQAYSYDEALARIRTDLGDDAVVLHTRTFKRGGVWGFWTRTIIEVVASTPAPAVRQSVPAGKGVGSTRRNHPHTRMNVTGTAAAGVTTTADNQPRPMRPTVAQSNRTTVGAMRPHPASPSSAREQSLQYLPAGTLGPGAAADSQSLEARKKQIAQWLLESASKNTKRREPIEEQAGSLPSIPPNRSGIPAPASPFPSPPSTSTVEPKPEPTILQLKSTAALRRHESMQHQQAKPPRRFILRSSPSSDGAAGTGTLPSTDSPPIGEATLDDVAPSRSQGAVSAAEESTTSTHAAVDQTSAALVPTSLAVPTIGRAQSRLKGALTAPASAEVSDLQRDLTSLKQMVGQVLQRQAGSIQPVMPEALFRQYLNLIENEVAQEIADELCAAVRDELGSTATGDDEEAVRKSFQKHLANYIPVAPDSTLHTRPADGRPLTLAFVGPTGVGKTTTVAKLAAAFKLRQSQRVGLITTDTYRIAAVDQLRTYANIIGTPLKVALTPAEMASACHTLHDCDIILIDTAGRSPNDSARIDEIRSFIDAASPHEVHLVLSSTFSEQVLMRTIDRFAPVLTDRIIFTKLDEAVSYGVLVNVVRKAGKQLSFITTGQEVPDHIETGRPDRLAGLVMGEGVAG